MIVVDPIRPRGAPWGSGESCHLTSDESVGELLDFARAIGIPLAWFQHRSASHPHFDLSPKLRARAIAAGALEVDARAYVDAVRRFRARAAIAPRAASAADVIAPTERRARPRLNLAAPMLPDDFPGRQR